MYFNQNKNNDHDLNKCNETECYERLGGVSDCKIKKFKNHPQCKPKLKDKNLPKEN